MGAQRHGSPPTSPMWLQYRQIGLWRSYVLGYLAVSLTAKSALAWQIYAGLAS